jgi:CRP/FNR family transcriptional regulator, cyclic AMP receptor protein
METMQMAIHGPGSWDHASTADWANVLADFPLFSGIAKRRLRKLVALATFAEYGPGDIVIQKGTSGDSLYVILGGSAKALGKPASRTLRTGDYFGELSLFGGAPRSATVLTTSDLHVMKLPRQAFLGLTEDEPTISTQMLMTLGSQIRRLEQPAQP